MDLAPPFIFASLSITFVAAMWTTAQATAGHPPSRCEFAIERASHQTGVPKDVLRTVALIETGKTVGGTYAPWPWALNHAGESLHFADQTAALQAAQNLVDAGYTNFDVGCFQINYRWHRDAFTSLAQMLNPDDNALYAAQFLKALADSSENWRAAAGKYHSHTPELAEKYRSRYTEIWNAHAQQPATINSSAPLNTQLFSKVGTASPGSLVHLPTASAGLFSNHAAASIYGQN